MKHGWRIIPKLHGDPLYADYVKRMAAEQLKTQPRRPKPVKPEGMSQEEWIFSMQPKSTQEIMIKQKDPDYKRDWSAPLPDNVLANPNAKTKEELIGERRLSLEEISHVEAIRRRSKNSLGQSEASSTSKETRERAAHHFNVTPPALLTDEEIHALTDLAALPDSVPATFPPQEWKKLTPLQAIWHWLKGGEIKRSKE